VSLVAAAKGAGIGWRTVERAKARANKDKVHILVGELSATNGTRHGFYWYRPEHRDKLEEFVKHPPPESTPPPARPRENTDGLADWEQTTKKTKESASTSAHSATPPQAPRAGRRRRSGGPLGAEARLRIGKDLVARIAQGAQLTEDQAKAWLQGRLGSRQAAESVWDALRVHFVDLGEDGRVLVRKPAVEASGPPEPGRR
jgi:hypothetical protein